MNVIPVEGGVPIHSLGPGARAVGAGAGRQPVAPAVRHRPRRADARRPRGLRDADRRRPLRRGGRRPVRHRRRHRLRGRPRRDRPDRRHAAAGGAWRRSSRRSTRGVPIGTRASGDRSTTRGRRTRSASSDRRRSSAAWWDHGGRPARDARLGQPLPRGPARRDGRVCVMLHSGSRSLGKAICDAFQRRALAAQPGPPRSRCPIASWPTSATGRDDFDAYWAAMTYALRFAEVNRSPDARRRRAGLRGAHPDRALRAARRHPAQLRGPGAHATAGGRRDGLVHRKGAVRARAGEIVLMPGAWRRLRTSGRGSATPDAFETCQHGAGRAMSRTAARKARAASRRLRRDGARGRPPPGRRPAPVAEEAALRLQGHRGGDGRVGRPRAADAAADPAGGREGVAARGRFGRRVGDPAYGSPAAVRRRSSPR